MTMRNNFKDVYAFFGSADLKGMETATGIVIEAAAQAAESQVTVTLLSDIIVVANDGKMLDVHLPDDGVKCTFNKPLDISAPDFGLAKEERVTLVNNCAEFMNVKIAQNGREYSFRFEQGLLVSSPSVRKVSDQKKTGTSVSFRLDHSLFYRFTCEIPVAYFQQKLKELSLMYPKKHFLLCIQPDVLCPSNNFQCFEYKS